MIITHDGHTPQIHDDAYVAPDATVCGDVTVAAGARIMHGARVIAEGGSIAVGEQSIVMQNAVVRSTAAHDCTIGSHVLVGPTAHVVGSWVDAEVFLATGTSVFHGSRIGRGSVVRIHGVVHVNTVLAPGSTVPIGWVAVGNPAQVFSADQHDRIWAVQEHLNFAKTAYGLDGSLSGQMAQVAETVSARLAGHVDDRVVDG
ncbi:MAG: gamma carbonic anhydrase family protein [Pseudomonadota bacterium]